MKSKFSLRFYGPRSKDRAKSVLTYAHCRGHAFSFKFEDVKTYIREPRPEEAVQVELLFDSEFDRTRWTKDQNLKAFYDKNAERI